LNVCQLQSEIVCAQLNAQCQTSQNVHIVRVLREASRRGFTQEIQEFALTLMPEMPVQKARRFRGDRSEILACAPCAFGRGLAGFELGDRDLGEVPTK
jgi:hypothetical protein